MITKGQIVPPTALITPLLELRDYYVALVEEYERLYTHARSQLAHVEALLSNGSSSGERHNQTAVVETVPETVMRVLPTQVTGVTHSLLNGTNPPKFGSPEAATPTSLRTQVSLSFAPSPNQEGSQNQQVPDSIFNLKQVDATQLEQKDENDEQQSFLDEESTTPVAAPATFRYQQTPLENSDNFIPASDVPMLVRYQGLSRLEAIEKILQDHVGTVCHIDFIVRSIYGDLESNLFKVVKSRVQSSLTHGKEKNYWSAVPDEPGCYTLDISLVTPPDHKVRARAVKAKKKKPFMLPKARRVPMLPEYEGKFLIDAICILLQKNSGKIFSVADVITGLYGEINADQLREIKTAVHNELSRGHRIGRFYRVPEKIGCYSWDLNKLRRT